MGYDNMLGNRNEGVEDIMLRQTLTVEETARILRISRNSAYEAARTGAIPTIKIGRRVLVPIGGLEQLLGRSIADCEADRRLPTEEK
jgi:excisionase family DNA binding protein